MISFVWSSAYPVLAGTGGSENYTIGQIRELKKRGIPSRIITIGFGKEDGRENFPDLDFFDINNKSFLSQTDDTLIFVSEPIAVTTKKQSYVILHIPPHKNKSIDEYRYDIGSKIPIVTSHYAASVWSKVLGIPPGDIPVVYPFASSEFSKINTSTKESETKNILFAGRLTPDKGIYTFMWVMHSEKINRIKCNFLVTDAGSHTPEGRILQKLVESHPNIKVIPSRKNNKDMASLLESVDILVMPTSHNWWREMFGMLSVEGQHAGTRVVASKSGGLPETDCGGVIFVEPDNARALEDGLLEAINLGRLSDSERDIARKKFTIEQSVDKLLNVINYRH